MVPTTSSPSVEDIQPAARGHRARWLAVVFSFPVMCMSLLAAAILHYCIDGIAEPDIWWHLRDASYLVQFHSFPRVNTYTFAGAGSPWLNFQWLSELPFLGAFHRFGLQGILVLYFLIIVAIFATVFYRCCYAGADCKNAAAATMGAICLGDVSMAPRTLLFGWLCMAALLLVLDHFDATGKGLWMLPFLFALWINLHGSWVFGMVVLCITIAAGLVQGRWGLVVARRWTPSQLKGLLLAFICSCLALFVNPFGYALVFYPKFLLTHQHEVMQSIEEWQPVNFATWGGKVALMLIFSVLATLLFSRRHWKLQEALIVLFSLWAALSHGRFMFFAALTIIPVLAPSLKLFPPYDQKLDKPWLNALIIAVSIAGMVFFFPTAAQIQKKIDAEFPRHAIDFIQKNQISGRIFNEYSWGGYMEWNAPRLQIFMDGRADVFIYSGVFHDYLTVEAVQGSFETLDRYGIDYVLIRPRQPLAVALQHSPQWRTVYSDKVAVLFRRGTAAAVSSQLGG